MGASGHVIERGGCIFKAQAADDPIAPKAAIPISAIQANPNCVLAITPAGGHLGWSSGPGAPFGKHFLSSSYQFCYGDRIK